jgi:flavin reductase (DIM6/NTAB) family NADH-FMN oxidoreductase RutF
MTSNLKPPDSLARAFRLALGRFVTGITVVTTVAADGRDIGMTVNSFNSVSLDPPLILWSIDRAGSMYDAFAKAERFAVNVLGADQKELARRFAGLPAERFDGVAIDRGIGGVPLLQGCIACFECSTRHRYSGGDHLILVGAVERFAQSPGQELLYFGGQYGVAQAL